MTDNNNNADFNSQTLIAASEEAVEKGVLPVLLVLTSEGNLEVKGSTSMVDSLKGNKKLMAGLKSSLIEKKKVKQYIIKLFKNDLIGMFFNNARNAFK